MIKLIGIAILMVGSVGWGQKPCVARKMVGCGDDDRPSPLECGKYAHLEFGDIGSCRLHMPCWEGKSMRCVADAPVPPRAAPLKCGKYQHVEYRNTIPDGALCVGTAACNVPYCADDLHTVTEREWQQLMTRLKALEAWSKTQ